MKLETPLFYERPSLHTEIYDHQTSLGFASSHQDAAFYARLAVESVDAARQACTENTGVLEVACGTGRVLFTMADALQHTDAQIHGLDASRAMLQMAQTRREGLPPALRDRIHLHLGDMADFNLGTKFAFICVPFRSFQMMWSAAVQEQCMLCLRRHLVPGGRLVINLFDPRHDMLLPGKSRETVLIREMKHPRTGHLVVVEVLERENDPLLQLFQEQWRFTEKDAAGNVLRQETETVRLRWTFRYEMRRLAVASGFHVEAEYSDFEGSAPAYAKEQVWVLRNLADLA
ncbi:hypothetical protein DB346_04880 [Verrucomicrobia bacterium LW23]|nr:hypothetical protein DB346_04880 [Verrucomicrobia bacterium LW23]